VSRPALVAPLDRRTGRRPFRSTDPTPERAERKQVFAPVPAHERNAEPTVPRTTRRRTVHTGPAGRPVRAPGVEHRHVTAVFPAATAGPVRVPRNGRAVADGGLGNRRSVHRKHAWNCPPARERRSGKRWKWHAEWLAPEHLMQCDHMLGRGPLARPGYRRSDASLRRSRPDLPVCTDGPGDAIRRWIRPRPPAPRSH
jgi:hypothetical protein